MIIEYFEFSRSFESRIQQEEEKCSTTVSSSIPIAPRSFPCTKPFILKSSIFGTRVQQASNDSQNSNCQEDIDNDT